MKQRFILILVCVAGMGVVLAGQAVPQQPTGDWPQLRGPDRTACRVREGC